MPLNYQQIQNQIPRFCDLTTEHARAIRVVSRQLHNTLNQYNDRLDEIIGLVASESETNKSLRCAQPTSEALSDIRELPKIEPAITLIAADGSQINPSRHRQVDFCLINVATISLQTGLDIAPTINTESTLLDISQLTPDNTPLTEDELALERDISERAALLVQARKYAPPPVTLTDGPLELFRETSNSTRFDRKLTEYIDVLTELRKINTITAGYVDKPRSDLVNRLLKLIIKNGSQNTSRAFAELERIWVPDDSLFSELLITPGDRSAIFCIQSPWSKLFTDDLGLCFFYLNVSHTDVPCLARIEIPLWCARDPDALNRLHVAIFNQCSIMSPRPYPYILHRAHELAIISYAETFELDTKIATELMRRGVNMGSISNKQSAKDLPGRGRRQ